MSAMSAMTYAERFLANLRRVDAAMVSTGHPAIHARWWATLERFAHSGRRQCTIRKGRRTGASSIIGPRVAVAAMLTIGATMKLPPGEVAELAFVSVKRGEAYQRLRNLETILATLGVPFTRRGDAVELRELPFVFQVRTASARTEVGPTICFLWCDEVSRWRDDDTGSNPAREVLGAMKPALATVRNAYIFLVSSPLSSTDFHAKEYDRGEADGDQCVDCFATWEATTLLTEADTRALETDPRVWAREYAAQPQASISAAFPDGIDHIVSVGVGQRPYVAGVQYAVALDAGGASRTGKSQTVVTVGHVELRQSEPGGAVLRTLVIDRVRVLRPTFLRPVKFRDIVGAVVEVCRAYHVTTATADIHLFAALEPELQQSGIRLAQSSMALPEQAKRSETLVSMVQSGSIDLPDDAELKKQMSECVLRERGSHFIITKPDRSGARDDIVDTILLLVEAQSKLRVSGNGGIRQSPPRINFVDGRLVVTKPARYYRLAGNGQALPVATPADSVEYKEHQRQRWAQGIWIPEDLREFGGDEEALMQAMQQAGGSDAESADIGLAGPDVPYVPDPILEFVGRRRG